MHRGTAGDVRVRPAEAYERPAARTRPQVSVASFALLVLTACSTDSPSILEPAGPSARRIEGLWWLLLWVSIVVFVVVIALIAAAIWRRRGGTGKVERLEPRWGEPFILVAGVLVPALILAGVFVVSVRDLNAIGSDDREPTLTIEVVGHLWWWEARYPDGVVTANELHIPVGENVRFEITTEDVIHSFWIPELAPKLDMIPGRTNAFVVQADRPGRYRGQCAEFCGIQHAHMAFFVIAQPRAAFDAWLRNEAAPAVEPASADAARGLTVFLDSACAGCHTVRGTSANGTLGPDLTHLASRETLAADTLPNTRGNLERWVADPQSVKPGAAMPPIELSPEELQALLDYLEGLG